MTTILELEELAKKATPGPYKLLKHIKYPYYAMYKELDEDHDVAHEVATEVCLDDANYFAAANPQTILTLISIIREQEKVLKVIASNDFHEMPAASYEIMCEKQIEIDSEIAGECLAKTKEMLKELA